MNTGKQFVSRLFGPIENSNLVCVSLFFQSGISRPSIGMDHATWLYCRSHERHETLRRGIWNTTHPNPTDAISIFLCGNDDKCFLERFPSADAFLQAPEVGLVNFYAPTESLSSGTNHCSLNFVKPCPGRFVASKAKNSLQSEGAGTVLLCHHPPNSSEPSWQRSTCAFKDCTRCHRHLHSTRGAHEQPTLSWPCSRSVAARASEAVGPA